MKKILIIYILFLVACVKITDIARIEDTDVYPLENQLIEVPEGKAVVLKTSVDTLAVLTQTCDVAIPTHTYIDFSEIDNTNNNLQSSYKLWEVVAFEDSKIGDYDYNDLVFHAEIKQFSNLTYLNIHPIALGSTKTITLGIRVNGIDYYISRDCRTDLFKGKEGIINTWTFADRIKYKSFAIRNFKIPENTHGKSLDWFIEVDGGTRLYAVSKNYPTRNRVYGLILININEGYYFNGEKCGLDWFDYPSEGVSIETVYPDFFDKSKTFKQIYSNKRSGYYPAIDVEGDQASENCLYAI